MNVYKVELLVSKTMLIRAPDPELARQKALDVTGVPDHPKDALPVVRKVEPYQSSLRKNRN